MSGLTNKQIAGVLKQIEVLLKLAGEPDRRAMTYGRLARMIEGLDVSAADLAARGELVEIKGIGPKVQAIVAELVDSGTAGMRDELAARVGAGVLEILRVPGLGPKRIHTAVRELGLSSVEELQAAALDGRLAALKGFGPKTAQNVLEGIEFLSRTRGLMRISDAFSLAVEIAEGLGLSEPAYCGELRRGAPLVGEISIVAVGDPGEVALEGGELVEGVWVRPRGSQPLLRVRLVAEEELARAVFEETGPAEHAASVLGRPGSDATEEEIYSSRGLLFVPPERRHACDGSSAVPELVTAADVRGLVHAHTTWSDGTLDIAAMAAAARERGYDYLGLSDHSRTAVYARGLSIERLAEQAEAVREFNESGSSPVRVLHGIESDILPDGSLDYPDEVLAGLDFVIASVHSSFSQDEAAMTERILRAVRHPHVDVLGHMTGRLLLRREPYAVDVERVLRAAAESGTAIELNANPWRLDIDPSLHERACGLGISIPIAPDAHSAEGMDDVAWGVLAARHGGLCASDVANCRDADGFLEAVGR